MEVFFTDKITHANSEILETNTNSASQNMFRSTQCYLIDLWCDMVLISGGEVYGIPSSAVKVYGKFKLIPE